MLLRSALIFVKGLRPVPGSAHCQPLKQYLPVPQFQQIRSRDLSRFARRRTVERQSETWSQLKAPFLFTVGTGSLCIFGNQYFGYLISRRSNDHRSVFHWWHSKPDWFKVYWTICGSCIMVFSVFRVGMLISGQVPSVLRFMNRYFVTKANPESTVESCAQLLLSAFSHQSPLHLGINMYILYNVTEALAPEIGKDKFLGGYIFGAVLSGFASMTHQVVAKRYVGSVGASGAILGLLGTVILRHPEYNFFIIFLPMLKIPGPAVFGAMACVDTLGVLRGWSFFDHAGHLGGLFSGVLYEYIMYAKSILNVGETSTRR